MNNDMDKNCAKAAAVGSLEMAQMAIQARDMAQKAPIKHWEEMFCEVFRILFIPA